MLLIITLSLSVFLCTEHGEKDVSVRDFESPSILCSYVNSDEDIKISSRFLELLFGNKDNDDNKEILLLPGGTVFGAKIKQEYVTVSDAKDVSTLRAGDKIITADGIEISNAKQLQELIKENGSREIKLEIEREGKALVTTVRPKEVNGEYHLGITLKDGTAGIGTITYIDPETGFFGGLGHGICDPESGEVVEMSSGDVTNVILGGVKKGEHGKPGELSGILTDKKTGVLYSNTECGVFGKLDKIPEKLAATPIKVAQRDEVHTGSASIISTVKMGLSKEFKIEITEVNSASRGTKSFKIKVTDPTLIALTGGVVRGMSGSPIIQDGKLIGAVTHVMVNEPTEGYGIFIENMLAASENAVQPKAA